MYRHKRKKPSKGSYLAITLFAALSAPAPAISNTIVRVQTSLGGFELELFSDEIALTETVNNFLNYVTRGDYDDSLIHRSVPGFVVQGGGFTCVDACRDLLNLVITPIPTDPAIDDQVGLSNTRGTIAMAKAGPDTATSQWFVNLADNSFLDDTTRPDGGFTVFGQVLGNGMRIFDAIEALPVLDASLIFGIPALNELPAVRTPTVDLFIVATSVGIDSDGDGITDKQENNGPNNGDANGDALQDSSQSNVASFKVTTNEYALMEVMPGLAFQSTDVMEAAYGLTTFSLANPPLVFEGFNFPYGYLGFNLILAAPGDAASVTLTLPAGQTVSTYFKYGPTPTEPAPHWYRFDFDGETGAQINGNVVTLHFVDGKRGDSDLDSSNGIITDPGAPALRIATSGDGGGGGGCSMGKAGTPEKAGGWWLMLLMILASRAGRRIRNSFKH